MLENIRIKVRSLIGDAPAKKDIEIFTYQSGDQIFILSEENILTLIKVEKNGVELVSGDYSYDSSDNELTIVASLSSGDIVTVKYTYTKYSDTELDAYITSALVWISVFSTCHQDFEKESDSIEPTPTGREVDLIALISSILIKPSYSEYKMPNLIVKYPRTMTKEKRIEVLIGKFNRGLGVSDILEWN